MSVMGPSDQPVGLAVMAKAPRPGAVKTRLCPPLRPPEAAELARCFLLDAVDRVGSVAGARPVVGYHPPEARSEFEQIAPGFALVAQEGQDLGARQSRLLAEVLAQGHHPPHHNPTHHPTHPPHTHHHPQSLVMAPDVDLVLGPTDDGGYYLVGLRSPCPALFENIPWSTSTVLARTLERAQRLGLRVACLPAWFDIDTSADLERLAADLAVTPGREPRHTRDFVTRRLASAREVVPDDHGHHRGGAATPRRG
jgi:rSAM/selenodomain-associated transferase 1